jgi:hypothetical protein
MLAVAAVVMNHHHQLMKEPAMFQGGLPQRRGDFLQQKSSSNPQGLQPKIIWECGQLQKKR